MDAPLPDEIQLEHVLQAREDQRSGRNNWMGSVSVSAAAKKEVKELVPEDLSLSAAGSRGVFATLRRGSCLGGNGFEASKGKKSDRKSTWCMLWRR